MPVYEYECTECAKIFEVQQKISDTPMKSCPECQAPVKKLVSRSSFQLKGNGWYADGYSSSGKETAKPDAAPATPPCQSGGSCAGCPASTPA